MFTMAVDATDSAYGSVSEAGAVGSLSISYDSDEADSSDSSEVSGSEATFVAGSSFLLLSIGTTAG